MRYFQLSCLILSIISCNVKGWVWNENDCRRFCCPYTYQWDPDCNCGYDIVDNLSTMCKCSDEEFANCQASCNPLPPYSGFERRLYWACTVAEDVPTCKCLENEPDLKALDETTCRRNCCPHPYTYTNNDACPCDPNNIVADQATACACSYYELENCKSSCISQYEVPGVVNRYLGECTLYDGMGHCTCFRTDEALVESPSSPPSTPCNDYQCLIGCCPRWGACDQQTGGCYCMDGTEDLEDVKKKCSPAGASCNEAEVEYCQMKCLSPDGRVFAFSECTRGSDGSTQCNCEPYSGIKLDIQDTCRRDCCPHPYTITTDDVCSCDTNNIVADPATTCACSDYELENCKSSCISQYEVPGVVNRYTGECTLYDRMPYCTCFRTDEALVENPTNQPPGSCDDHQCQIGCCPRWGACDPQTGGCYCMDGTEDLQDVQKKCSLSCTEDEVQNCQQHCLLSPEESGYVFAFSECTRDSDRRAHCNCQPYQG